MKINDYRFYYFVGIGGIGMSALARYFRHYGKAVAGYDKTVSALTKQLESEGITCHYNDEAEYVSQLVSAYSHDEVLVIFTPAVPAEHKEFAFLRDAGYRMLKRSQALGEITSSFRTIAVAGTHGKTTTTTLVTHILRSAGINCFSFMGGISRNYNTNLLLGDADDENAWVVVEADEYDRSFLTLEPYIALITSSDADHLDIYGDASHVRESYALFARRTKEEGVLIVKKNVDNDLSLKGKRIVYSLNLDTEYRASAVVIENGQFVYDVLSPVEPLSRVTLGLPGLHNVENSIAAIAIAQQLGVKGEVISSALSSFKGVKRRFETRFRNAETVLIDDYAHHPAELEAAIGAAKQLYPGRRITGVFQPHLFSRTRDFADGFGESLSMLDECILLDIYPAREKPMEGVTSSWLLGKVRAAERAVMTKDEVLSSIAGTQREVLLMMGAGDIDRLIDSVEKILIEKNKL